MYPLFLNPYYRPALNPVHYAQNTNYHFISPSYSFRQYPTVDPTKFMSSAKEMEIIMHDASTLLTKMATSRQFSFEFMSAAQEGKQDKIQSMLKSTGVKRIPKVSYTPDGLHLIFESENVHLNCCQLTLKLRWV